MGTFEIALVIALAVGACTWVAMATMSDRAAAGAALARAVGAEGGSERDLVLASSRRDRILIPFLSALTESGRRITPLGYRDKAAKQLRAAGRGTEDDLDRFLAMRMLAIAAVPVTTFLAIKLFGSSSSGLAVAGLFGFALVVLPGSRVAREATARRKAIGKQLPDVLDLLVISIEAGLGFEQALERTIASVPGPLSDEFSLMLGEVRAGATRADSLRALAERVDVDDIRRFVLAVLQADKFGVSIGRMLRGQADEVRVRRRQNAQERAQKAPVKMLVPMVFCIFPSIFVVIIGPAILNIIHNFK